MPVYLYARIPVRPYTCMAVYLYACIPVNLCTCLPVNLYARTPVYLCTCLPVHLSTCLPVHLYARTPVYLCTSMPVHLYPCMPGLTPLVPLPPAHMAGVPGVHPPDQPHTWPHVPPTWCGHTSQQGGLHIPRP